MLAELLGTTQGPDGSLARSPIAVLQSHVAFVYAEAGRVRPSSEEPDAGAIDTLIVATKNVLALAREALDVISVLYEDDDPAVGVGDLADVVGVASMSLWGRQSAFNGLPPNAPLIEKVDAIESIMRAVQKSMSAVDRALAMVDSVPASIDFHRDAEAGSVEIRRRYVRFREIVEQAGTPEVAALPARLRSVGNAIAKLLGIADALQMRSADRAVLTLCRARIREYLASGGDGHAVLGLRLWQDIVHAATMFLDVQKREELVLHDLRVAQKALATLDMAGANDTAALRTTLTLLVAIRGRSAEVDALLASAIDDVSPDALRAAIEGVTRALDRRPAEPDEGPRSGTHALI